MNALLFLAGGLVLLLLLGCVAGRDKSPAVVETPTPQPAPAPSGPPGEIGDKDLSVPEEAESDPLAGEDLVVSGESELLIGVDDIFVDEMSEEDPISEDDILLPE